jgi:predicted nucleic acid-binding protein
VIVVDTNLIAYFFIQAEYTDLAERVFQKDPQWTAPILWRSEFRSVLVKCLKDGFFTFRDAVQIMGEAEALMAAGEYTVGSLEVLRAASSTDCSVYDAEFVVLAQELVVPLVTMDKQILKDFPETAVHLVRFAED